MNQIEIIPTCVPTSADDVSTYAGRAAKIGCAIHLDIDDGILTSNVSWPFVEKGRAGEIDPLTLRDVIFDVHLMVSDCREIGKNFIQAGARSMIAHIEANDANTETLSEWKQNGAKNIGVAILIDTELERLNPLLPFCTFVHVMSVATIGAQGAPFDPRAIERVQRLHEQHPDLPIQVDGGVSRDNIVELIKAGATRFAIGSAITTAPDPAQAYEELLSIARAALY